MNTHALALAMDLGEFDSNSFHYNNSWNASAPNVEELQKNIYNIAKTILTGGGLVAFGTAIGATIQASHNWFECCECCPCNRARKQHERAKELKEDEFQHQKDMEQEKSERIHLEQLTNLLLDQFVNDFEKYQETIQRLSMDTQDALRNYFAKIKSPFLIPLEPMQEPEPIELSREEVDEGKEKINETTLKTFSIFVRHARTQLLACKPVDKEMLEEIIELIDDMQPETLTEQAH